MKLAEALANRADLQRRINRTNLSATLADGETTLTDALARRDGLTLRYGTLKTLVSTASDRLPRYGRAEIRILPAVEVGPLRRTMDELARQRRELDTSIQEANWAIDLTEGLAGAPSRGSPVLQQVTHVF